MVAERQRAPSSRSAESLGQSLRALLGHTEYARLIELGKQAPDPVVDLACPRCKGAGWLRRDVEPGHPDFGQLVECRCGLVANRRAKVYEAASRIPALFADLDLATFPSETTRFDMASWWHEQPSPWLILTGDLGVGKTGLAIGLVKKALAEGKSALYRPFGELLSDIKATWRSHDATAPDEADLVCALKTAYVVALDDLGAGKATGWAQDRLFEILNHRYNERRRTILTTNLGPDELIDHVGDRILSRITGMGWIYQIVGSNLREGR